MYTIKEGYHQVTTSDPDPCARPWGMPVTSFPRNYPGPSSSGHSRCLSASTPAPGSTTLYLYRGYCQHSLLIAPLLHFLMPRVQHKRWGLIAITLRVVVILSLRALIISRHLGWLSLICHKIHIVIREIHTHQNSHRISVPTFILLCLQEFPPWILSRWLSLARGWKRCILLPSTQMTLG